MEGSGWVKSRVSPTPHPPEPVPPQAGIKERESCFGHLNLFRILSFEFNL
jgi:hypothetical protein